MKKAILILLAAAAAGFGGWWMGKSDSAGSHAHNGEAKNGGRKILFYQSAMHPWIKSDKPGNCTICGMKLTPVYEGDTPKEVEGNVVQLSSNSITVLNVQTAEVVKRPLKRTIRAAGILKDDETRRRIISAYVAGRIEELAVNFVGAEVRKGSPLATFYSPDLLAAEREFVSLLPGRSTAHTVAPEAHHPIMEAAAMRLKRMGLTDLQITNLATKAANSQQSEIVAPMSGTVINRHVYPGQYVMEGEKLFEIADFSRMWLEANIYERDLPWVRTGQVVRVTSPALPGRVLAGRVSFINPTIDAMTRSAIARVELENPIVEEEGQKRRLLSHLLYAEAVFEVESEPVLAVERSAILNPDGKPIAYVDLEGGAYEPRNLKLGRRGDDTWEILEGVEEGDKIVVAGNFLIDSQAQLNHGAQGHSHAASGGHP